MLPLWPNNSFSRYLTNINVESPGWVAWLVGASSCTPKVCGIDSWSGHIPRVQVWSPVGACTRGNKFMFLSHIDVPLSLSLINKHNLKWRLKKRKVESGRVLGWGMCVDIYISNILHCRTLKQLKCTTVQWLNCGSHFSLSPAPNKGQVAFQDSQWKVRFF